MLWVFKKIRDRLKMLLVADAALDLEAEFLDRHAERKAELLRKAQEYEEQGFENLAEEVRLRAMNLSAENPLASMLPAIHGFAGDASEAEIHKLNDSTNESNDFNSNGSASQSTKSKKIRKTKAR